MPWINKEMCTGCQLCVDECSAGAIFMDEGIAIVNDSECIRCGVCHELYPCDAVRHDGERIPEEVECNLAWATKLLGHEYYSNNIERQRQLIERLQRYFTKNRKVMEKTIERLEVLRNTKYSD